MRKSLMAATMVFALTLSGTAWAGPSMISSDNPQKIADTIREAGFSAKLTADDEGDPKIEGRISRTKYSIYFYSCNNHKDCASIQFSAGFDLNTGTDAAKINEWNKSKRWAKAHIDDEGDPFLNMDVNMRAGVHADTFLDTFEIWQTVVTEFETFIDWK